MKLAADFNKQSPKALDWVFTHEDSFRDPKGLPDLKALQANIDGMRDIGLMKDQVDVEKYADLSLVKEAAVRLK